MYTIMSDGCGAEDRNKGAYTVYCNMRRVRNMWRRWSQGEEVQFEGAALFSPS